MANDPNKPSTNPSLDNLLLAAQSGQVSRAKGTAPEQLYGDTGLDPLGKYDAGILRGMDQEKYRAATQTGWQAMGNAFAQSIAEIGLGTLEGIGYLGDLPQWKDLALGQEKEFGNWFSDIMIDAKEGVAEGMPVHGGGEAFDPGNPRWWMANAPSVASSLSLMIPAMGATRVAGAIGRFAKGISKLEKIAMGTGRATQKAKTLLATKNAVNTALFSRYMENTMEASGVMESEKLKYINQGMSEEEATERAAVAARNTWYANIANLVTDIPQYMLLMKGPAGIANAAKESRGIGKKLADVAKQAISEGAEEGFQYGISKAATTSDNPFQTIANAVKNVPEYQKDDEFWASVTLGAAGGVAFDLAGKGINKIMSKSISRYKTAAAAYEEGDWITGIKQQYDEARDMIFRGEGTKLQDIIDLSEDDRLKPLIQRMAQQVEQLSKAMPKEYDDTQKQAITKHLSDAIFYEGVTNDLQTEVGSIIADSKGKLTNAQAAKIASEMIDSSNIVNKGKAFKDVLTMFGVTEEEVDKAEKAEGSMAPVFNQKVEQLGKAVTGSYTANEMAKQEEANAKQSVAARRQAAMTNAATGQQAPAGAQGGQSFTLGGVQQPSTEIQSRINEVEAKYKSISLPSQIEDYRDELISNGDPMVKHLDDLILGDMRQRLTEVVPEHHATEQAYLDELNKNSNFKTFGNKIKGVSGLTAEEVAKSKWQRINAATPVQTATVIPQVPIVSSDPMDEPVIADPDTPIEEEQEKEEESTYGKSNTIVNESEAEKARRVLKAKLGQFNVGIDPELMQAGITLAAYHIEAGARKFVDYARKMVNDMGEGIRPYLKMFYNGVRDYPGFDGMEMDSYEVVRDIDVNAISLKESTSNTLSINEKRIEIENQRKKELAEQEKRNEEAFEKIKVGAGKQVKIGQEVNTGYRVIVKNVRAENFTEGEGYEVYSKIISEAEYDADGKLSKAAVVETELFNNKEDADRILKEREETLEKSKKTYGVARINKKYDAQLAELETRQVPIQVPQAPIETTVEVPAIQDQYNEKLAEQKSKVTMELDGQWLAVFKPVGVGQEKRETFETKLLAEDWLEEEYASALSREVSAQVYDTPGTVNLEEENEEQPADFTDEEQKDKEGLLGEAIFPASRPVNESPGLQQKTEMGRQHMFGITYDVVISRDGQPLFEEDGQPRSAKTSPQASVWNRTGISGTVSYEEMQEVVRHLADNVDWVNTPVFLEVDPTLQFHQRPGSQKGVETTPHAHPLSPVMNYSEEQIEAEKKKFFGLNTNHPDKEELERAWNLEESFMRLPGARGADQMNVSYVIYKDGKRIPLGIQQSHAIQLQHFGMSRSSGQWQMRYQLWKKWSDAISSGQSMNGPIQHDTPSRFARDNNGNPVYMAGRFFDHPSKEFALDHPSYKHETEAGKHLVLMVPITQAQGTMVEMHTPLPEGRIMNAGNYTPGFPYILVKDTMGNYVWSRVYSRTMEEAPQAMEELNAILAPMVKAKEAFRSKLIALGYDPDAVSIPEDVSSEVNRYSPSAKNRIARKDARFPEVYDFMETGWKSVQAKLHTLFRYRERGLPGVSYGPRLSEASLFRHVNSGSSKMAPFSVEAFIAFYQLNERPLQIDVSKIEDVSYVESIAWRLKTNTDPVHPMISPTFFYEVPKREEKEVVEEQQTEVQSKEVINPEYEGLSEEDIRDLEDFKTNSGKYDGEWGPDGIKEDGDQPDPDFPEPDDESDFAIISTYEAFEADYIGQDLNKMEPYLIERLIRIIENYQEEVTPGDLLRLDESLRPMVNAIDKVIRAYEESSWSYGPYRESFFKGGFEFTEESYRAQDDFIIVRSDQSTIIGGRPLEFGKMAIINIRKKPLFKQVGPAEFKLMQRGEVEVLANTVSAPEKPSIEESKPQDPSIEEKTTAVSFKPNRRDKKPPRFKKATDTLSYKLDEKAALAWLAKRLPASIATRITQLDADTWGYTQDQLIVLSKAAPERTTYHEAFHAVYWNLLTDGERATIMKEARKKYGSGEQYLIPNGVDPQIWYEEHLADDFEQYVMDRQDNDTAIGKFFKNLWSWIQTSLLHRQTIETFYNDIYRGAMAKRRVVSKEFIRYSKVPGLTIEEEKAAVDIIMQLMDSRIDDAMDALEKLRLEKRMGNKKDSEPTLAEEYGKVLNLQVLFSENGILGDIFDMGIEDMSGQPTSQEQRDKLVTLMKGLDQNIITVNFETGKLIKRVTGLTAEGAEITDPAPGPLYFKILKSLAERGIRVKFKGSSASFSEHAIGQTDQDEELEFSEQDQDVREWWTIANVSISPKEKLTPRLRRWMSRLQKLTPNGDTIPDPFGLGMTLNYSPNEVYPVIQSILGNSDTVDEMINRIEDESQTDPLFASMYEQLQHWRNNANANALATQLFTHIAQKIDPQQYVVKQYVTFEGLYKVVAFPAGSKKESVIASAILEGLIRMSTDQRRTLEENISALIRSNAVIPTKDFATQMRAAGYSVAGSTLRKMPDSSYKRALSLVLTAIKAYNNGNEVDAARALTNMAKTTLAPYTSVRQQAVHMKVTGSKAYGWINANFIGRQISRFANRFNEMVEFYATDPLYNPNGNLLPLLRNGGKPWELVVSDGIKYHNERVGRDYTKFTDRDMVTTMLSYYQSNVYLLPVFNDSTVLAGVKIERDKSFETSIEEVLDVAYSEWLRTKGKNGKLDSVKNYEKNSKKAVLFDQLLTEKGKVVAKFDRDKLREKLKNQIDEQAIEMYKKMSEMGMLAKTGNNHPFIDSSILDVNTFIKEFIASHMAVHSQLVLLTMGDPAFYKSVGDFFKRSKEIISPGTYLNDKAVFVAKDGTVTDLAQKPFMKMGIVSDLEVDSDLKAELEALDLYDEYKKFSLTDGTTYIDPVSYRDREIGLNRWTDEKEDAFNILMRGELPRKYGRMTSFQPFKPFLFSLLKLKDGRIKPLQKKDSELRLDPFYGRRQVGGKKNPYYNPLHRAVLEQFGFSFKADKEGNDVVTYNSKKRKIDMLTFDSTIKVGAQGVGQFEKATSANGNEIHDISTHGKAFKEMQLHDIPMSDWRLQQETPPHHFNTDVVYGVQIMKLIVSDLDMNGLYLLPSGRKIKGKELLQAYKKTISQDIGVSVNEVEKMFGEASTSDEAFEILVKTLRQEVIDRGMPDRFSEALEIVKEPSGRSNTRLSLSHPLHINRIESLLNSMIRKKITKRKFSKGFAFVDATPAGFERMPKIVFNEDGSLKHYEVYVPIHDKRLFAFVNEEGFIDEEGMNKIRADRRLSKLLDGILYRTPTEGAYSIFPIHIIGFLPVDDGIKYGPPELTKIAGLDFDIDKSRGFYYAVGTEGRKLSKKLERDNRKLALMKAATQNVETTKRMLTPGGFEEIEANNLEIRKVKNWEALEGFSGKVTHDVIDQIENSLALVDPMTQVRIARRFNAGQDLISIAAVNNSVHAIWNQVQEDDGSRARIAYTHPIYHGKQDSHVELNVLNENKDVKGQDISRNIASTVAAFVDNGRNPQADFFNMNDYTANVAYYMLHVGVDMKTVQYFLSQPAIVWWVNGVINNGGKPTPEMEQIARRNAGRTKLHTPADHTAILNTQMLHDGLNRTYFASRHGGEKAFYEFTYKMLDTFIVYHLRASRDINQLVQATKVGDSGLGTNQVDNMVKMSAYWKLSSRKKNPFTNFDAIFDAQKEYMAKFFFEGIARSNDLVVQLLEVPNLNSVQLEELFTYMEFLKGERLSNDEMQMLYRSMYDYLISNDPDFVMQDGLGMEIWDRIQALGTDAIDSNLLLSALRMVGQDLTIPTGTLLDHGEEVLYTESWRSLMQSHPDIARDLARYSVMRNGFKYTVGGFSHLQPLEIYTQYFPEMMDNYRRALWSFMSDREKVMNFADQFIRNNHMRMNIVRMVNVENASFIANSNPDGVPKTVGFVTITDAINMPRFMKHGESLYKLKASSPRIPGGAPVVTAYYEWTPTFGASNKEKTYTEYYFNRHSDGPQDSIFEKELDQETQKAAMNKAQEFSGNTLVSSNKEDVEDIIDSCN